MRKCDSIEKLRNYNIKELRGYGDIHTYTPTELTNELHKKFNIETDFEIVSTKKMKKYFTQTKNKK